MDDSFFYEEKRNVAYAHGVPDPLPTLCEGPGYETNPCTEYLKMSTLGGLYDMSV